MAEALRISLATPGVKGIIVNVFGGINNCEAIARGICQVVDDDKPAAKIVVKMRGHSQEDGWKLLEAHRLAVLKHDTSDSAVRRLVGLVERQT